MAEWSTFTATCLYTLRLMPCTHEGRDTAPACHGGTTKGISATDISVSTSDGVVILSGAVSTTAEKASAERVARSVKGVKSIDTSGLTVGLAEK